MPHSAVRTPARRRSCGPDTAPRTARGRAETAAAAHLCERRHAESTRRSHLCCQHTEEIREQTRETFRQKLTPRVREVRRQDSVITVTRDTAEMILLPEDHEADTMAIKEMDSMKENKKGRKYSLFSVLQQRTSGACVCAPQNLVKFGMVSIAVKKFPTFKQLGKY